MSILISNTYSVGAESSAGLRTVSGTKSETLPSIFDLIADSGPIVEEVEICSSFEPTPIPPGTLLVQGQLPETINAFKVSMDNIMGEYAEPIRELAPSLAPLYQYEVERLERLFHEQFGYRVYTEQEVIITAKMVWGEGRGLTRGEKELIIWTVLQRMADPRWPNTISGVITQRGQFHGYSSRFPVCEDIVLIVRDVFEDWVAGASPLVLAPWARSAPYFFFASTNSNHNWFRENYR
jgi:hypothetical protein